MGILVVSRLVQAGYRVFACDVDPDAIQRARELGAVSADTPQNVAEQAEELTREILRYKVSHTD